MQKMVNRDGTLQELATACSWPSVISCLPWIAFIMNRDTMAYLPSNPAHRRPDRAKFSETTPVVLRFSDGNRASAKLKVVSVTGGLLGLSRPLAQGLVAKMMFLTQAGSILGEAQMLNPLSWDQQPFRFVSLHQDDHFKLESAIKMILAQDRTDQKEARKQINQVDNFRAW